MILDSTKSSNELEKSHTPQEIRFPSYKLNKEEEGEEHLKFSVTSGKLQE